jgi:hypothetical protein
VKDKEQMFRTCNRLAIIGEGLLALAMAAAVFVISCFVIDYSMACVAAGAALSGFVLLWFALPLSRRRRGGAA